MAPKKLTIPNFILYTDACQLGIAAILSKEHDGVKYPIVFASRQLQPEEIKYSIIENEFLAALWA
jgi:hypothetical protein